MKPRVEAIAGNSGVMNPARKPTRLIIRHQGSKRRFGLYSFETKLLTLFCRDQASVRAANSTDDSAKRRTPLEELRREFPNLDEHVIQQRVVDFGCGVGAQSLALVKEFDCDVLGLDINGFALQRARESRKHAGITSEQCRFSTEVRTVDRGKFDVVISQNSFEHFDEPEAILQEMASLLNENGKILLSFGPPWYAPNGSHMRFFCRLPWVNLIFSEKAVMTARAHYRNDGAKRYEDVSSGLNKMSVNKFERIIKESGLTIRYRAYRGVKNLNFLTRIPVIRELMTNHISVVLEKS